MKTMATYTGMNLKDLSYAEFDTSTSATAISVKKCCTKVNSYSRWV